jgi:hypothetical protein
VKFSAADPKLELFRRLPRAELEAIRHLASLLRMTDIAAEELHRSGLLDNLITRASKLYCPRIR